MFPFLLTCYQSCRQTSMAITRSSDSSSNQSRNQSSVSTKTMDFSYLVKTLSLNLTLKLEHNNFIYWRTQVITTIEVFGLEGMINREKQPPPKVLLIRSGDEVEQQENPEYVNWRKTDKLLMSWIFSTLTINVLGQVNNSNSSFEIWSKIERTYSQRSLARIMNSNNKCSL